MIGAAQRNAVLAGAPVPLVDVDLDARVTGLNPAAEGLLGRGGTEVLGRDLLELLCRAPTDDVRAALTAILAGDDAHPRRLRIAAQRPGGTPTVLQLTVARSPGQPPRWGAWIEDVGAVEQALAEAQRREVAYAAVEELAGVGSWDWAPTHGVLDFSENLYFIYGAEPGEVTPTPEWVIAHSHPDDRAMLAGRIATLAERGFFPPTSWRHIRPTGDIRVVHSKLSVVDWDHYGLPARIVGCVRDVTDSRRAERDLAAHVAVAEALVEWSSLRCGGTRLLTGLAGAFDAELAVLWVPDGGALAPRVCWAADPERHADLVRRTWAARVPPGVELAGTAWQLQAPQLGTRVPLGSSTERSRALLQAGLEGGLAIPAITGAGVLAVIELRSPDVVDGGDRRLRTLTGIGFEIGQFLGRRRAELDPPLLTARELEILALAARGLSARRTAEELVVSMSTVRTHVEHIYAKLGVSDKAAAVARALRDGLIE